MLTREEIGQLVSEACAALPEADQDEMAIPSYLHGNPAVRWIIRRRLQVIAALMRARGCRRWLDFGCGLGLLAHQLSAESDTIFVTDIVLEPVRALVARYGLANVVPVAPPCIGDAVVPGTLDAIVAADVLEHVEDLDARIGEFGSLLRADGVVFLSGPTESGLYKLGRLVAGFSGAYHVRSIYDVEESFARAGWRQVERRSIPSLRLISFFRVSSWRPPAPRARGGRCARTSRELRSR